MLFNLCYGKQHLLGIELEQNKLTFYFKETEFKHLKGINDFLNAFLDKEGLEFAYERNGSAENHRPDWHMSSFHIREIFHVHFDFKHAINFTTFKKIITAIELYQTNDSLRASYESKAPVALMDQWMELLGISTKKLSKPFLTKKQIKQLLNLAKTEMGYTRNTHNIYNLLRKSTEKQNVVVPQDKVPVVDWLQELTCPVVNRHAETAQSNSDFSSLSWNLKAIALVGLGLFAVRALPQQNRLPAPVVNVPNP